MRRYFSLRAAAAGTALAVGATALSFVLAVAGFGNVYYVSVFMPFSMLGCLAVAWFSFLRDDGFARRPPEAVSAAGAQAPAEPRPAEPLTVSGLGSGDGLDQHGPVAGGLDASLFAPRDGSLVGRRVAEPSSGNRSGAAAHPREGSAGRAALLWAAVELGAASACLYAWAGLGSSFYR